MTEEPRLYALKRPEGTICWWSIQLAPDQVDITASEAKSGWNVVRVRVEEVEKT